MPSTLELRGEARSLGLRPRIGLGIHAALLAALVAGFVLLAPPSRWDDPLTLVVLVVLGVAVAPYMISVFTLAERMTPPRRTGAAMTLLAATTGIGYALGSTVAGQLADRGGHTQAYAVTVAAGVLATVLMLVAARSLRAGEGGRGIDRVVGALGAAPGRSPSRMLRRRRGARESTSTGSADDVVHSS